MTDEQIGDYSSERFQIVLAQNPNKDPNVTLSESTVRLLISSAVEKALSPDYPELDPEHVLKIISWLRKEDEQGGTLIDGLTPEKYAKKLGSAIFSTTEHTDSYAKAAKVVLSTTRKTNIRPIRQSHARIDDMEPAVPAELLIILQLSHNQMSDNFKAKIGGFSDIDKIIRDLAERRTIDEMTAKRLIMVTGVQEPLKRSKNPNNSFEHQESIAKIRQELKNLISERTTKAMKYPTEWKTGNSLLLSYLDYTAHNKGATVSSYMQTINYSFLTIDREIDTKYLLACMGYSLAVDYQPI